MAEEKKKRVVITGMGVNCSAGGNVEEFYKSLHDTKSGVVENNLFDCSALSSNMYGEIYDLPKGDYCNRVIPIIDSLIEELFRDTGFSFQTLEKEGRRCHLSFATSLGINYHVMEYIRRNERGKKSSDILTSVLTEMTGLFQNKMRIRGPYYINSAACTAGTTAVGTAYSKIVSGHADMVVSCSVEPLTEFAAYGFHSLNNMSESICKPFDQNRDGLTLGEGGAIFLLEEYEHAKKRGAKIYCEVLGYGIGNDAYHPTSPEPGGDGAYRTIKMALEEGNIAEEDIDYMNMHGTGTTHNDSMEVEMLKKIKRKEKVLYINSIKSYVGHCLAAGGGIEIVATILTLIKNEIFATYGLKDYIGDSPQIQAILGNSKETEVDYALSNSYAFAGNSASILLGKVN